MLDDKISNSSNGILMEIQSDYERQRVIELFKVNSGYNELAGRLDTVLLNIRESY